MKQMAKATTIEELQVLITAETKNLREGLKELRRQISQSTKDAERGARQINQAIDSIGKTIKRTMAVVAGYFTFEQMNDAVTQFGVMEASLSNVQRTLGDSAKTIVDWANTQAAAFGMAKDQAIVYSNTMSILVSSFIKDQQIAADVTQNLLENAGIIASRTGRTIDDVLMRITSGLRGETEAIEDLGVFVHQSVLEQTNAFKQLAEGKSWNQLSEYTKQQIRAYAILEQTMQRYGDTVSGGVAMAQADLRAQLRNLKIELGAAFAPITLTVIPQLIKLIEYLRKATAWLASFTQTLFKVQNVEGAKSQNKALNDFNKGLHQSSTGLDEADKKAKKLKSTLVGFDEINKIVFGEDSAENPELPEAISGDPLSIPPLEANEVIESAKQAAEKVKKIFNAIKPTWENFFTPWKEAFNKYSPQIKNDFLRLGEGLGAIFKSIGSTLDGIFKHQGYKQFVDGAMGTFAELFGFLVDGFRGTVAPLLVGFFDGFNPDKNPNMDRLMTKLGELSQTVKNFVSSVREHMAPVLEKLAPLFGTIGRVVSEVLIVAFSWASELLRGFFEKLNPDNNPAMARFIEQIGVVADKLNNLIQIIGENLIPVFQALEPVFRFVGEVIGIFVIETLKSLLGALEGVIDFLTGIFTGDWRLAWEGIKNIVVNIVELVILKKLAFAVKNIKKIFEPLKGYFEKLWGGIKNIKERIFGAFGGIATRAKNAVLAPFKGIANIFKGIFDKVVNTVRSSVNFLIDRINNKIDGINKVKLPDFMGGHGINIPKIPRLARGGIVDRETMFIAGEAGKEVVMPLEHNTAWISQLANKIANLLPQTSPQQAIPATSDRPLEVVLQIGQTKLARAVIKSINQLHKQEGRVLLDL